jgi:hypothetical protein
MKTRPALLVLKDAAVLLWKTAPPRMSIQPPIV